MLLFSLQVIITWLSQTNLQILFNKYLGNVFTFKDLLGLEKT